MSGSGSGGAWATPEDWAFHQQRITELYKKNTLREVMQIMRDDWNFHASQRMFKTRFDKWGLQKNFRASQVSEILRQKDSRTGKATALYIQGKKIDDKRLETYLQRVSKEKREQIVAVATKAPGDVEVVAAVVACRTPSPPPSMPSLFPAAEESIRYISTLVSGNFDSGIWQDSWDPPQDEKDQVMLWCYHAGAAKTALERGRHKQGFRLFDICLGLYKRLLATNHPILLIGTMTTIISVAQQFPDLTRSIIGYISGLSHVIYHSSTHPYHLLMKRMSQMTLPEIHETTGKVLDTYMDSFRSKFKQDTALLIQITKAHASAAYWLVFDGALEFDDAERVLRKALAGFERLDAESFDTLNVKAQLVDLYYWNRDFDEARKMTSEILLSPGAPEHPHILAFCYRILFWINWDEGNHEEVLRSADTLIKFCIVKLGHGDDRTVNAFADFGTYLREQGDISEAEKIQTAFDAAINELCEALEKTGIRDGEGSAVQSNFKGNRFGIMRAGRGPGKSRKPSNATRASQSTSPLSSTGGSV